MISSMHAQMLADLEDEPREFVRSHEIDRTWPRQRHVDQLQHRKSDSVCALAVDCPDADSHGDQHADEYGHGDTDRD